MRSRYACKRSSRCLSRAIWRSVCVLESWNINATTASPNGTTSNCNQSHKDLFKNPVADQPQRYAAPTKPTQNNKKTPPSIHQRCRLIFIVFSLLQER